MNGNSLTAHSVDLGYVQGYLAPTIENRGAFVVGSLGVGNTAFNLNAVDSVSAFALNNATSTLYSSVFQLSLENGSTVSTTANGSVTGTVDVDSGSMLKLGTNLDLNGFPSYLNVQDSGSTVNAQHFGITTTSIYVGSNGKRHC